MFPTNKKTEQCEQDIDRLLHSENISMERDFPPFAQHAANHDVDTTACAFNRDVDDRPTHARLSRSDCVYGFGLLCFVLFCFGMSKACVLRRNTWFSAMYGLIAIYR